MFLQRAFNNIPPTKKNLYKRRIVPDSLYPICALET
jgi:hypothetical protein